MATNSESLGGWFKRPIPASEQETTGHESADEQEQSDSPTGTMSTTGGGSENEPVVVWEAANRLEAEIVRGRLESEDIPAIIQGEALGPIYGLTTGNLAATVVLVPAPLADKAIEILNTEVEWEESEDDFGSQSS